MTSRPFLDSAPLTRTTFANHFWTAQLIAGTTMALKMYPIGKAGGGAIWQGLLASVAGFVAVIPFAALITYLYLRFRRSDPADLNPRPTRWLGATLVALVLCSIVVGASLIGRYLLR